MGKRYYAGVPGLHEKVAPAIVSSVQRGMNYNRKHRSTPDRIIPALIMFIIGLPFMPIWSGMMMIGESIQLTRYKKGTSEYQQKTYNIAFASVFFCIGLVMYSFIF